MAKVITASFPGTCADCRGHIEPGQAITGSRGRPYSHVNCDVPNTKPEMHEPDGPPTDGMVNFLRRLGFVGDIVGMTKQQVSDEIDRLKAAERKAKDDLPGPDVVPAGRYAYTLTRTSGSNGSLKVVEETVLINVWRGSRNPSFVRCYLIEGDEERNAQVSSGPTLAAIVEQGVAECAVRYGQLKGRCYRCNHPLDDLISVELSMGPVCAEKLYSHATVLEMKAAARAVIRGRGLDPNKPRSEQMVLEIAEVN